MVAVEFSVVDSEGILFEAACGFFETRLSSMSVSVKGVSELRVRGGAESCGERYASDLRPVQTHGEFGTKGCGPRSLLQRRRHIADPRQLVARKTETMKDFPRMRARCITVRFNKQASET